MNVGEKVLYKGAEVEVTSPVKSGWLSVLLNDGSTRKVRLGEVKRPSKPELPPKMRAKDPATTNPRVAEALTKAKEAKPEPERVAKAAPGPQDNGDEVAAEMRNLPDLNAVYAYGAAQLRDRLVKQYGIAPENAELTLRTKYSSLNPGQQRMVIGNLVRGHRKALSAPPKAPKAPKAAV